jgi:hypothetical protein
MFTFSQMVDDIVSEVKRPDLTSEIARYVNQTIRECHFSTDRQAAVFFSDNFNEVLLTADVEEGFSWTRSESNYVSENGGSEVPNAVRS